MTPSPDSVTHGYPNDPTDILRQVLALEAAGEDVDTGHLLFTGVTPPQARGRVFGGQVMAQSLMAAAATVDEHRLLHSMHCYFIRPGDAKEPITFAVHMPRDGRSFSVRHIEAKQHGKVILSLSCSFQDEASGLDHAEPMPVGVTPPDQIPPVASLLEHHDDPLTREFSYGRPFDIRYVDSPIYEGPVAKQSNTNTVWMKTFTPLAGPLNTQSAALAYASDYTLLESILRQHGKVWTEPGLSVASLDHAMWFHRPVPMNQWLLYVQNSPSSQGARGLALGHVYTQDGVLVASTAQEGMVRLRDFKE